MDMTQDKYTRAAAEILEQSGVLPDAGLHSAVRNLVRTWFEEPQKSYAAYEDIVYTLQRHDEALSWDVANTSVLKVLESCRDVKAPRAASPKTRPAALRM